MSPRAADTPANRLKRYREDRKIRREIEQNEVVRRIKAESLKPKGRKR